MKQYGTVLISSASLLALTGCRTSGGMREETATGALAGGAVGATTGALIGAAAGNAGSGALIGAAAGALGGGLIGHQLDQEQQAQLQSQAPVTYSHLDQKQPLDTQDVKELSRAGVSDAVIEDEIRASRTIFRLSTADILDLKDAGVSDAVIDFMLQTSSTVLGAAAEGSGPPPAAPVEFV